MEVHNGMASSFDANATVVALTGSESFKQALLDAVKARHPDFDRAQHFYLARPNHAARLTYLYWAEMKLLWILSTSDTEEERNLGVRYPSSDQLIDLQHDVVATESDVGNHSDLVSRNWAEKRLFETVVEGDLIMVGDD